MGLPGCVFLFFTAILCALGSDEPLKLTPWIPKTLKDGVQVLDLPLPKSANKVNVIVKPINGSQGNQEYEPVRFNIERKALDCGSYDLQPGQSVNIESKNFPKPFPKNWQCTWDFMASSPSSKISIECKPFNLKGCKLNSLQITGGKTNKKFCGNKKKGIKASSSNNKMTVAFTSKKKTSTGFKCTVSASGSTTTTMAPPAECKSCGTVNRAMRIVGGVETEVNEYPWQAALVVAGTNNVFCGAIVYNDRYVITAAHCAAAIIQYPIATEVLLGAHDVNDPTSTPSIQRITATHIIPHGSYDPDTNDNDIALLRLETAAILNDQVKPACLPDPAKDYAGVDGIVSGWGTTSEGGSTSSTLMEVMVPILTNAKCQKQYKTKYEITQNMICAEFPKGGKDSCQGDSGGPLVVEENGNWVLIGVVSFGYGCARKGNPGVYARVSQYLDFLTQNTAEGTNNLCAPTCKSCGTVNRAMRIVGGVETEVNEYPWQAALVEAGTNNVFCGAIVYNDRYVITAAHCGAAILQYSIATEVLLGAHDVNDPTSTPSIQRISPTHLITHGSYDPDTNDNDIALLKLETAAILNDQVKPACLPDPAKDYAGVDGIVSGWGTTSEGGSTSSTLMEVMVPILTNAKCQKQYKKKYEITQNMICAGFPKGGKDSCQGDSGGPLVVEENGNWVLIGVVSFGYGCARKGNPGVYARVSQYLDFLTQNTAEGMNNLCAPPSCTPCGTVNRATRIVNGVETEVNEYPWQVALVSAGTSNMFCSAVVYNDRFILTVAQCIQTILNDKIATEALFGAHDLDNPTSSVQRIPVIRATYLNFNNVTFDNDIGLLELATPVTLSEIVKPACLPNANEDYAGVDATASGWGQTEDGIKSTVLLEGTMTTLSYTECLDLYGSYFPITENMICAGYSETSQNICFGDSGGPLVVDDNGQWTLIGLTSWVVNQCSDPNLPSGFARVSRYLDFLAETAASGQNNLCSKK